MWKYGKVKVIKVIRKGHWFVKAVLRLLLLSKHNKFQDAIAWFCYSNSQSQRRKKNLTGTWPIKTWPSYKGMVVIYNSEHTSYFVSMCIYTEVFALILLTYLHLHIEDT